MLDGRQMGDGEVEALQTLSQHASLLVADGDVAVPSALTRMAIMQVLVSMTQHNFR